MNNSLYGFPSGANPNPVVGNGCVLIGSALVTGAVDSITFRNIPQDYNNLRLIMQGRGDNASTSTTVLFYFNGDVLSNYDFQLIEAIAATISESETFAFGGGIAGRISAASAAAGLASSSEMTIPGYSRPDFQKTSLVFSSTKKSTGGSGMSTLLVTNYWRNVSPIYQLHMVPQSGKFVYGTTAQLYGMI